MFILELKKLVKKKIIFVLFIFSILISIYTLYDAKFNNIENKHHITYNQTSRHQHMDILNKIADSRDKFKNFDKAYTNLLQNSGDLGFKLFDYDLRNKNHNQANLIELIKKAQLEHFNFLSSFKSLVIEHNIPVDNLDKINLDWTIFEYENAIKNDIYVNSADYSRFSTNSARIFIFNSDIYIGLAILLLLIFLFHGTISEEIESGNYDYFRIQPIKKIEIIISKIFSIFISGIVYLFFTTIIIIAFSPIFGFDISGFNEIYRIMKDTENIYYINGLSLILKIFFNYTILLLFISTFIVFISNFFKTGKYTIVFYLTTVSLLYIFTIYNESLQTPYNPLYITKYMNNILGTFRDFLDASGNWDYKLVLAYNNNYLYFLLGLSFLLFIFTIILKPFNLKIKNHNFLNFKINSLLKFEIKKLIQSKTIFILISFFLVIISFFFIKTRADTLLRQNYIIEIEDYWKEKYEVAKKKYEENITYEFIYKENKKQYEYYDNIVNSFTSKNSNLYYDTIKNKIKDYEEEHPNGFKNNKINKASFFETELTLDYINKNKLEPILYNGLILSEYQEYIDNFKENNIKKEFDFYSYSSVFFIYKLFTKHYFDIFILIFILLIIGDGYVLEKEQGDNIATIYTQPLKRNKYSNSKYIGNIVFMLFFILIIFAFSVLLGIFGKGFRGWRFPIIEYKNILKNITIISEYKKSVNIISILEYIIRVIILIIMQGSFIISIKHFFSIFTKHRGLQQLLTISLLILGFLFTNILPNNLKHLLPFNLLQASRVANGTVKFDFNMINQNFYNSIIVLAIYTIIFIILERIFVNKIDQINQ